MNIIISSEVNRNDSRRKSLLCDDFLIDKKSELPNHSISKSSLCDAKDNKYYHKCSKYVLSDTEINMLNKYKIIQYEDNDNVNKYIENINLYLLCNYTLGDQELIKLYNKYGKYLYNKRLLIYAIPGMDQLVSKKNIVKYLKNIKESNKSTTSFAGCGLPKQSISKSSQSDDLRRKSLRSNDFLIEHSVFNNIIPKSYIIQEDLDKFKVDYFSKEKINQIYILKKDIQRQEGLYISKNYEDIINKVMNNDSPQKYVVIQEYLKNPYIIDKRKINIRYYVLITIENCKLKIYIFSDGFLYYTRSDFKYIDDNTGEHTITTGYIDRKVYEKNPLTLNNLSTYLWSNNEEIYKNYNNIYINNIYNKIKIVILSIFPYFNQEIIKKYSKNVYFQLFGVDIEPNNNFTDGYILEFNKNPDMGSKDPRDFELKSRLYENILSTIKLIDIPKNNKYYFNRIY